MALRVSTLRQILRPPSFHPGCHQRRWARVHHVRFLATHGTQEQIMLRYRDKLESKARQEGKNDIDDLKEQYKEKIDELRKQAIVPGATGPLTPPPSPQHSSGRRENEKSTSRGTESPQSSPWPSPPPPPSPNAPPPPGIKTLSSFLDVPKIQALPEKDIQALWRLRHASNPQSLHFAVPANIFSSLLETAKQHPSFILPVPREIPKEGTAQDQAPVETQQAAELHYLQFAHPHQDTTTLLFTSLAEFKLKGEFASPHTTITFHQELIATHNLVLGQGIVMENRGVSLDDARWLIMCMQKFYVQSAEGKGRVELLHQFTRGDSAFNVKTLLDEAEKVL